MEMATLNVLEEADLPAPQARAIARAIEIECTAQHAPLATKLDMAELSGKIDLFGMKLDAVVARLDTFATKLDLSALRAELVRWVFTVMLAQTAMLISAAYVLLER